MPSSPSMMAMTRVLARSGSTIRTPWSSASEVANSAVASRNPTVAAAERPRAATVPTPGITADAAHEGAAAGDGQQVVAFQHRRELRRRGLRMLALQPAEVGQDQRPLDFHRPQEHVVDAGLGLAVGVEHRVVGGLLGNLHCRVAALGHRRLSSKPEPSVGAGSCGCPHA